MGITDHFIVIKDLDEGAFGTVFLAKSIKSGEQVAIKKLKRGFSSWDECLSLREVKSLRKLNHPNIVKLKEVLKINDQLYMVFEFVDTNLYKLYLNHKKQVSIHYFPIQKIPE
jgi:protein kinase